MFSVKTMLGAALTAAAIVVLACGGSDDTAPPVATSQATAASGSSEQASLASAAAAVKTFRTTFTVELPSKVVERGTLDFVSPDRGHYTLTVSGSTNEIIVIGTERYSKVAGAWSKLPAGPLPRVLTTAGSLNQLAAFRTAAQTAALNKGESDTVEGKSCQVYSHNFNGNSFEYCVAEGLPLRMRVIGGTDGTIITFHFTGYDLAFEINPPI